MPVATFDQPDRTTDSGAQYPANIDASISVLARLAAAYAPHAEATPADLDVVVDAGAMFVNGALVANAAQTVTLATADATNPRIDRVVIDALTGVASKVDGTPAGSPTAPAIPAGKLPVAQVLVTAGMTVVANSAITDERTPFVPINKALHGKCYLKTDGGGNLLLEPCDGNTLYIDSILQTIPDAGITLSPSGLTANTTYYIYAYMNAGVMTLEASTTAYAAQAGTGIKIKSADATRTLVGLARRDTSTWVNTSQYRGIASYFNRRDKTAAQFLTSNVATPQTGFASVGTSPQIGWVNWADDTVLLSIVGACSVDTAGASIYSAVGLDGGVSAIGQYGQSVNANSILPVGASGPRSPTEGWHYADIFGRVSAGTGTWYGSATVGERCGVLVNFSG